jgi:arginase family enzyme
MSFTAARTLLPLTLHTVAPATGTPETGGWTTRELRTIMRGLEGINLIAADIVEVAPAYDTNAELTTMAAAVCILPLKVG